MRRCHPPIRLAQVLRQVFDVGMIGGVGAHGFRPVVAGPENAHAGLDRALGEATEAVIFDPNAR